MLLLTKLNLLCAGVVVGSSEHAGTCYKLNSMPLLTKLNLLCAGVVVGSSEHAGTRLKLALRITKGAPRVVRALLLQETL